MDISILPIPLPNVSPKDSTKKKVNDEEAATSKFSLNNIEDVINTAGIIIIITNTITAKVA